MDEKTNNEASAVADMQLSLPINQEKTVTMNPHNEAIIAAAAEKIGTAPTRILNGGASNPSASAVGRLPIPGSATAVAAPVQDLTEELALEAVTIQPAEEALSQASCEEETEAKALTPPTVSALRPSAKAEEKECVQAPKEDKGKDFEAALSELEKIVSTLEGEVKLEDALRLFDRGMNLSKHCQDCLQDAEQRIDILKKAINGSLSTEKFNEDSVEFS